VKDGMKPKKENYAKRRINKKRRYPGRNKKTVKAAKGRLKNFRQASVLAVSITGFLLILFSFTGDEEVNETGALNILSSSGENAIQTPNAPKYDDKATEEAIGALQDVWESFLYVAPKLLIAIVFIVLSWLLVKLFQYILHKGLKKLPSSTGIISMVTISLWIFVVGIVFSIIAGDMRALLGSIGLVGLALSWALQTPIESFTGWLLNAFKHYYKTGDRIKVGEVFGDVYKIDFLTTTIWEIGSPSQPGYVNAEQPTGRLVTFPNNEILAGSVVNLTGDFPYVWDELVISITSESDIKHVMRVLEGAANKVVGGYMKGPIRHYAQILRKAGLPADLPETPSVYITPGDSWIDLTVRYLVGARERRQWKTNLFLHINETLAKEEHKNLIFPFYPRQQVQIITDNDKPAT
jgi:small-conductance mechanosensitive channel